MVPRRAALLGFLLLGCGGNAAPAPAVTITGVDPPVTCSASDDRDAPGINVRGTGFTLGTWPEVTLSGPRSYAISHERIRPYSGTSFAVQLPAMEPGPYDLTVVVPGKGAATMRNALTVNATPEIDLISLDTGRREIDPQLCTDIDQKVIVRGRNFRADAPPSLEIGSAKVPAQDIAVDDPGRLSVWIRAGILTQAAGPGTSWRFMLRSEGCAYSRQQVEITRRPQIKRMARMDPRGAGDPVVCQDAAELSLQIFATDGQLVLDAQNRSLLTPEIRLTSGNSVIATADTASLATPVQCSPFRGCSFLAHFNLAVPLAPGDVGVHFANANGCDTASTMNVRARPTITRITPVAGGMHGEVEIEGSGFHADLEGGWQPSVRISRAGEPARPLYFVTVMSPTLITAQPQADTPPGTYDLTVTNPEGCAASRPGGLVVRAP